MPAAVQLECGTDAQRARGGVLRDVRAGVAIYLLTTLPVLGGAWFGTSLLPRQGPAIQSPPGFINSCCAWDGMAFARIAEWGYQRKPDAAFFPAYPMLARGVMVLTGARAEVALVFTSHLCLAAAMLLAIRYARDRDSFAGRGHAALVPLAMGLWPTTFFLRMGYSDALLLVLIVIALYGMERGWPRAATALVVGAATATRPTGFALIPVLALAIWRRAERDAETHEIGRRPWRHVMRRFGIQSAWAMPLGCWGALAYMLYLNVEFSDPFLFAKAQSEWTVRSSAPLATELRALLTLEPLWSCYVPQSTADWARFDPDLPPLFSLQFANPIYFVLAAALIALGAWKRCLNEYEVVLGAMLLLIPYVTHSYRAVMMGHARYAAVVFPAYIVLGRLAARCPPAVLAALAGVAGALLAMYSALFAAWYRMI